jgi:hypothetical protein
VSHYPAHAVQDHLALVKCPISLLSLWEGFALDSCLNKSKKGESNGRAEKMFGNCSQEALCKGKILRLYPTGISRYVLSD